MRGAMPFSRSWALPEKMISMPRISALPLSPQRSCRDARDHGQASEWATARQRERRARLSKALRKDRPRSTAIGKPSGKPD